MNSESIILAIDPGSTQSAYVLFTQGKIIESAILPNAKLASIIEEPASSTSIPWVTFTPDIMVIEFIQSYGMPVGREIFETVFWTGKFALLAEQKNIPVKRVSRPAVKSFVCQIPKAKDQDVRRALILKYGGTKKGEPLHGIKKDLWAALAVADYSWEGMKSGNFKEW